MKFLRMYHRRLCMCIFIFQSDIDCCCCCCCVNNTSFRIFVCSMFVCYPCQMHNSVSSFFSIFETSLKKKLKKVKLEKYCVNEIWKKNTFSRLSRWKNLRDFVCFSSTIFRFFWSITQFIWFAFVFATGYVVYDFLFCPKKNSSKKNEMKFIMIHLLWGGEKKTF